MKKWLSILLAMILILSALPAVFAETDSFSFRLFEIIKDGIVYRAYGNNEVSFQLYTDGSMMTYGLTFPDEEKDPMNAWRVVDDGKSIILTIDGQEYCLTEQNGILILPLTDRDVVFRLASGSLKEAASQPADHQTLTLDDISECVSEVAPLEFGTWTGTTICYRMDGNCCYRFNSDYGVFLYVVDTVTGEVVEKEEPDMEAARAQEGFRERLSLDEIVDIVAELCPVDRSSADKISRKSNTDGTIDITFVTRYGDFFYKVDAYTGEVKEKIEPDLESVPKFITSEQALAIAEETCPLDVLYITSRKVSKSANCFIVTLGSNMGDYIYTIDKDSGEITDKQEPDVEVTNDASVSMSMDQIMDIARQATGRSPGEITGNKLTKTGERNWAVTISVGECEYYFEIDGYTGQILDSVIMGEEPAKAVKDPFQAAIDAAFASIEGYDYSGENIRVSQTKQDGKDVIMVSLDWHGKNYVVTYSIADQKLID